MILNRNILAAAMLGSTLALVGCSESGKTDQASDVLVTDVAHSAVKRQSIGNCWLYAKASWVESLHLNATGEEVNTSESYWTWWHFYNQIVGSRRTELSTGGSYYVSANILLKHGVVLEGEFIPAEADRQMSQAQSRAEMMVNAALQPGGKLANVRSRTAANVRKVLDEAFGSNMAAAEQIARPAAQFVVGKNADGSNVSLYDALAGRNAWRQVNFPAVYGKDATASASVIAQRKALLKRVFKALNDRKPVIMTTMIDFNALDTEDATFKKSLVDEIGIGRQGGHMVVLEDYVVENVAGFEGPLPEGDLPDDVKAKAVDGDLVLLKAKNSWGTDRPDRGLTDGYNRFDKAYLTSQMAWKNSEDSDDDDVSYYTTLSDFVLPPGY